ncbi:TonB-dependent receptor [Flavobacterium rivuli WB 3.3-2 = DSM 21788]|uniref:TonB-dependent receptor n=1 Tax=Flavobacterium rivuli WB 3.3-2 = DSM 21788 TaxID=1121895 RepID=A0A0A2M2R2_9FLAO|nr:SusC/RagA family TonB-linked outer membrane protein [Flavobacterium rivuli]KGO85906.1 TonB-dependent receptor [Flavobacterium rivuli WB 3.3-2 = DSM 21788]
MNYFLFCKGRVGLWYTLFLAVYLCSFSAIASTAPTLFLQEQKISGVISDAVGPLAGVTIAVKGSTVLNISDEKGRYTITASVGEILLFSFTGFRTIEIAAGNQSVINVVLSEDATQLEEVVVNAGYYSVRQKESTGSIARITSKDIEKQPVPNVLATMQGRMAGVDVTQTSGVPGGGFDIRIRGLNSLRSSGNAPLYIIDGVPYSSDAIGDSQTSTTLPNPTSPINTINPNDIESIEILKDADATAIYGSRGANGVVLITTKKGKTGETKFTLNVSSALGQVTKKMNLLNTQQYLAIRRQAFANDGITEYPENAYDVNGKWSQTRTTDWQKELTGGTALITNVQAGVSGGSTQTHFLISGNTYKQSTVFPGNFDYKKGGVHVSIDHEGDDKKFKAAFSASYDLQDNNQPAIDLTRISRNLAPNAPALYDAAGNLNWEGNTWTNPLAALGAKALAKTNNLVANGLFSYRLPLHFTARVSAGFTDLRNHETKTDPSTVYDPAYGVGPQVSSVNVNTTNRHSWIIEPQLNWNYATDNYKLDVLLGSTLQNQVTDRLVQFGAGFSSNSLIYDLVSANYLSTYYNDQINYKYQAAYGRVNLAYGNRYFLNLTGRRDGSSRFGPGRQFANFGAVGGAWLFSEEKMFKETAGFLSLGKLRGSYGITGNDQIGDYQYLDTYQSSGLVYDGTIGLQPTRLYNPDFSWESNRKIEIAIELGFFKDRIFAGANWYRNRSSNQLIGIPLPSATGFTSMQANLGATVQNTGLEFTLRTVNVQKKDFEWTSGFNITLPKNKLIAFPGLENSTYRSQYVIGESINIQKLYHYKGINPQTGVYEFDDVNGDGSLSFADDAQTVRDFSPKYYGGLSNQLHYKHIQLDFLFQFVKQLNWNAVTQYSQPGSMGNQPASVIGGWQPNTAMGQNQVYTTGVNSDAVNAYYRYASSDAAVSDASYIRLKNIAVSYELPSRIKGMQCRLFLQGQNLLTITPYKDGDPEFRSFNYLPPLRIVSFGTEIKF